MKTASSGPVDLKINATGGQCGAILGMVLVLVVAVCLVGLGLLQLAHVNAVEVSRSYNVSRAFWVAEAGLFDVRARLRVDEPYRKTQYFPSGYSNPNFGYSVWVSTPNHVDFEVLSTGVVQGAIRIVQTSLKVEEGWPSAFDYALFSGEAMKLAKDTSITGSGTYGDIYAEGGYSAGSKVPITNGCEIYDGVPGNYPAPSPVPSVPVFDTSYYDGLLTTAAGSANVTYPASLSGTYYVNQSIDITTAISGSGTLVVNGSVSIVSGAAIAPDITIIASGVISIGSATTASLATFGSNDVFYSATGIGVWKGNVFSAGRSALITPGNISIDKEVVFSGLIYAGGDIIMDKAPGSTATITGCVVAGGDLTLKKDFIITYDASQLPDPLLPGFITEVTVTEGVWREVF